MATCYNHDVFRVRVVSACALLKGTGSPEYLAHGEKGQQSVLFWCSESDSVNCIKRRLAIFTKGAVLILLRLYVLTTPVGNKSQKRNYSNIPTGDSWSTKSMSWRNVTPRSTSMPSAAGFLPSPLSTHRLSR